jgi:hypothetical protein
MTPQPTARKVITIMTTNNDPYLLVRSVDDEHVTGVLLTDLATETIHRLGASEPDTATRRELAIAAGRTDDLLSFTVPTADCALIERDSNRAVPFEECQPTATTSATSAQQ